MIQYRSHWKHWVRHHGSDLRQAAALTVSFAALYGFMSFYFNKNADAVILDAPRIASYTAPQPHIITPHIPDSLLSAEADIAAKPSAPPATRAGLAERLSSIQTSIASILEASNRLLVSEKKVVVGRGDTLMDILINKGSVSRDDAYQVVQALGKVYNPRDIIPGREITVFFHQDPSVADPKFIGMRIEKDIVNAVAVNRDNDGKYTVNKIEKEIHRTLKGYRGTIESSLYVDAKAAGVPDAVILQLIKMYSWNVDFQREIHTGDKFEVMYEEYKTEDGKIVRGRGNIIYAKLGLGGRDMPFYRFEDVHGDADYYDHEGKSAKRPLMKTPIDGARLSSGFGKRKHPVLGFNKMHEGVDFAAPRGTPIYAAGDGVIAKIGPYSSYGNYVRIRHRSGLETVYAHMKNFKAGLQKGSRVKQGTVIGYVGTTGRSTGPHLHYEVIVNNAKVNPNSVKLPTGRALKGKELKSFQRVLAQVRTKFNGFERSTKMADNRMPQRRPDTLVKN